MIRNVKTFYSYAIISVVIVLGLGTGWFIIKKDIKESINIFLAVEGCNNINEVSNIARQKRIDCLHNIIENEIGQNGITAGWRAFLASYLSFGLFANECHEQAHRVGDAMYYNLYLTSKDILSVDFPPEMTICRMGAVHGFVEHLVQDNPNPAFVTKICEYMRSRFNTQVNGIGLNCYHGAGHGFQLAHREKISPALWGSIYILLKEPLGQCEQLNAANKREQVACLQGVFDNIAQFIRTKEYGFSKNTQSQNLFLLCDNGLEIKEEWRTPCFHAMVYPILSEMLSSNLTYLVNQIASIVAPITDEKIKNDMYSLIISHVVRTRIADNGGNGYKIILALCMSLKELLYKQCIDGIIDGIFTHGKNKQEYQLALMVCNEPIMLQKKVRSFCYQQIFNKMRFFYTTAEIMSYCKKFPADMRDECEQLI